MLAYQRKSKTCKRRQKDWWLMDVSASTPRKSAHEKKSASSWKGHLISYVPVMSLLL